MIAALGLGSHTHIHTQMGGGGRSVQLTPQYIVDQRSSSQPIRLLSVLAVAEGGRRPLCARQGGSATQATPLPGPVLLPFTGQALLPLTELGSFY